jgi:hypothetical protein
MISDPLTRPQTTMPKPETLTMSERLEHYNTHLSEERQYPGEVHPDGCFYCGRTHPSDPCRSRARWRYWHVAHAADP